MSRKISPTFQLRPIVAASLAVLLLQACGGTSTTGNAPHLSVSADRLYFGTRDVGASDPPMQVVIENQSADIYPLKSFAIVGADSEEFSTNIFEDVTLNPAEKISVDISFRPITEGQKKADFVVDFETIVQVEESVNVNEQNYYEGRKLETSGYYQSAADSYQSYMDGNPVTVNKRRAAIKLPVLAEAEIYGEGDDFQYYLTAMNLRENGNFEEAREQLEYIEALYPDAYLADDALYLQGYIALMDEKDHGDALRIMQKLRKTYPDSTYYDTALYSEALAQQELGNDTLAREILVELRDRHTGIDILGVTMARDTMVSRLWFERASTALDTMDAG